MAGFHLAHGEALDVRDRDALEEGDGVLAAPPHRAHVRHVEEPGLLPALWGVMRVTPMRITPDSDAGGACRGVRVI